MFSKDHNKMAGEYEFFGQRWRVVFLDTGAKPWYDGPGWYAVSDFSDPIGGYSISEAAHEAAQHAATLTWVHLQTELARQPTFH